jgi:hypothetical protein
MNKFSSHVDAIAYLVAAVKAFSDEHKIETPRVDFVERRIITPDGMAIVIVCIYGLVNHVRITGVIYTGV